MQETPENNGRMWNNGGSKQMQAVGWTEKMQWPNSELIFSYPVLSIFLNTCS